MQREYGLDLADQEVLDRVSWRKLQLLVAHLGADSALMLTLRRRRQLGDVAADQVITDPNAADAFWKRRAGKQIAGGAH